MLLTSFVALRAADAGYRTEDGSGMVWVAEELLAPVGDDPGCRIGPLPRKAALHFEAAETMAAGTSRMVSFEWNATTGELSIVADAEIAALTLPEHFVQVASDQPARQCESR